MNHLFTLSASLLLVASQGLPALAHEEVKPHVTPVALIASMPVEPFIDPVVKHQRHNLENAPADEYFGPSKMSVLGIRNTINDISLQAAGANEETGHNLLHKLLLTEIAYHDWQNKYPNDSWLLKNGYKMVDDFTVLDSNTPDENPHVAATHGLILVNWLGHSYPGNKYSQLGFVMPTNTVYIPKLLVRTINRLYPS